MKLFNLLLRRSRRQYHGSGCCSCCHHQMHGRCIACLCSPLPACPLFSTSSVEDLLLWHDVTKSGIVLGAATALYVLLEWSGLPLLTWLSNLGLVVVLGAVLWAIGARFMGRCVPSTMADRPCCSSPLRVCVCVRACAWLCFALLKCSVMFCAVWLGFQPRLCMSAPPLHHLPVSLGGGLQAHHPSLLCTPTPPWLLQYRTL